MSISGINAALQGLQAGQESLAKHAEKVAQFGQGEGDLVTPIVGITQASTQVKASAVALKTQDETQRTLLDTLA